MKHILLYSKDFSFSTNMMMYLQNDFSVKSTTSMDVLKSLTGCSPVDLILIDTDPDNSLQEFLKEIRGIKPDVPVILTYVFKQKIKEVDSSLRKYVNSVFYKPYDLNEVTKKLAHLTLSSQSASH